MSRPEAAYLALVVLAFVGFAANLMHATLRQSRRGR